MKSAGPQRRGDALQLSAAAGTRSNCLARGGISQRDSQKILKKTINSRIKATPPQVRTFDESHRRVGDGAQGADSAGLLSRVSMRSKRAPGTCAQQMRRVLGGKVERIGRRADRTYVRCLRSAPACDAPVLLRLGPTRLERSGARAGRTLTVGAAVAQLANGG